MIIRGILDNSLNGQLCIRGFAPIGDLAQISKADYEYQRKPIERDDILDFLEKQAYLFFPEIILGYKITYSFKGRPSPLLRIQEGRNFSSKRDNIQMKVRTIDYKQNEDVAGSSKIRIIELTFDAVNKPLSRIDGNHRLIAAEDSSISKVKRMIAPFCIILGEEFCLKTSQYTSQNMAINEFDKAIKVFFHNINTKTKPLTYEENLKVLIEDKRCFPNDELKDILGVEGVLTRELIDAYDYQQFTGIQHIIWDNCLTCYMYIFSILHENDKNVEKVLEALKSIDRLYAENVKLKTNSNFGLLCAFLYYKIQGNEMMFERFKNWVFNNHLFSINEIKAESLILIFDKIAEQEVKIFVAMPYFEKDPNIVREYNEIYENVVKEIKERYGINISLFPIMENKGETQDQIQGIINKIKQCNIFIADISNNNANVMYETGWARGLDKHVLLFREKNSEKPKSDYANDIYHEYDDNARSVTLKQIALKNIIEVLNKKFGD